VLASFSVFNVMCGLPSLVHSSQVRPQIYLVGDTAEWVRRVSKVDLCRVEDCSKLGLSKVLDVDALNSCSLHAAIWVWSASCVP